MSIDLVYFLAIVFLALIFAPAAAHLFALRNKIGMNQPDYYIAQRAYRRWDIFGWPYLGALVFTAWLAIALRGEGAEFWLSAAALFLTALSLVIFFIWVFPGNRATRNWTVAPENWDSLRRRWEYGHAGSAGANFLALCLVTAAATLAGPSA
jgi:hypothetical protein